jgi:hypothetical protein
MKLYHGAQEQRARIIEEEGFLGSELDDLTIGQLSESGVVFFSDSIEEAREYGEAIFEIDSEGEEKFFQVSPLTGNTNEYYIPVEMLSDYLVFERMEE